MKFDIPQEEVWVRQVYVEGGHFDSAMENVNRFLLEAATINKDFIRNVNLISSGEQLVVIYEAKLEFIQKENSNDYKN